MTDTQKDELIGAEVSKIYVNKVAKGGYTLFDLNSVLLETNKGNFVIEVYGDCCSTGYIDHIGLDVYSSDTSYVIEQISDVGDISGEFANTAQDSDAVYGLKIKFERGGLLLEYRNSSNGYYGSSYEIKRMLEPITEFWEELTESF